MSATDIISLLQTAAELGLISSITVLALFLSYSMLGVCDLSTDGCFTLGAAVGAVVALSGHPILALPAAMLAGACSGLITATLQTRMGVNSLLAGIAVNTGLWSINLAVMGNKTPVNLFKIETVFTKVQSLFAAAPSGQVPPNSAAPMKVQPAQNASFFFTQYKLITAIVAVALVIVFLSFLLRTRLGLAIRATGNNPDMVRSSSINPAFTTTVGLCVSGSLTALSGCLLAQYQKQANIDIGSGMVTVALASLLIGGVILRKKSIPLRAVGAVLGAIVFRLTYTLALRLHMPASMLKLVSSVIVIATISIPYLKTKIQQSPAGLRRAAAKGAKKC